MSVEKDRPLPWVSPLAIGIGVAGALLAAFVPLVPDGYRLWNYSAFGAVALFVAARGGRVGLPLAVLLGLGAKLPSDLIAYAQAGYHPDYEPSAVVYSCLALYAVIGFVMLRRSQSAWRVAEATFLGGLVFFLVTNFVSWQRFDLPYDSGPLGLLQSYAMALPFYRGTLLSDFTFAGLLFGLHALAVRAAALVGRPVPVREVAR